MSHKFDKVLMGTAVVWSVMSYCKKRQVGAVISIDGKLLMTGYNGTLSGKPNQCEDRIFKCTHCDYESERPNFFEVISTDIYELNSMASRIICKQCNKEVYSTRFVPFVNANKVTLMDFLYEHAPQVSKTNQFVYHAEENAIMSCSEHGIPTKGTEMHVTTAPCPRCAKLIARAGVIRLVYMDDYKDDSGIKFLKEAGVKVEKISSGV